MFRKFSDQAMQDAYNIFKDSIGDTYENELRDMIDGKFCSNDIYENIYKSHCDIIESLYDYLPDKHKLVTSHTLAYIEDNMIDEVTEILKAQSLIEFLVDNIKNEYR